MIAMSIIWLQVNIFIAVASTLLLYNCSPILDHLLDSKKFNKIENETDAYDLCGF